MLCYALTLEALLLKSLSRRSVSKSIDLVGLRLLTNFLGWTRNFLGEFSTDQAEILSMDLHNYAQDHFQDDGIQINNGLRIG